MEKVIFYDSNQKIANPTKLNLTILSIAPKL